MPRPKAKAPSLRYHLSGQSVTTIDGKDYYLGKHDSPESLARYAVLVRIYQEHELSLPHDFQLSMLDAQIAPLLGLVAASHQERQPNLVRHLTAAYLHHATRAYANSKSELHRAKQVCGELDRSYGNVGAEEFGPRMLKQLREKWVDSGKARKYVNSLVQSVWRIWRFGVSEELVSESTLARLKSLEPLREGQTTARENEPRKPVAIEVVRRTVAELSPVLRDMVRVHVATGMRPSELCSMRPCDIDRSGETWV